MTIDDRTRAIALALTPNVGWKLIHRLLDRFENLDAILSASPAELRKVPGIGQQIAANIRAIELEHVSDDITRFSDQGIHAITWRDPAYPPEFTLLEDKPLVLFWKGELSTADADSIAIVGMRDPHQDAVGLARQWADQLARRGWTIVSGLARGIDTAAHSSAIQAGGRTNAILGSGVNVIYPHENRKLATQIISNGMLISELHPDAAPSTSALMRRNRLIASFARAVIVMEAGAASGALHAARFARAQDRPVFAVDNSAGNAALLREFAIPLPVNVDELIAQLP